ncbi:protein ImuB [Methylocapsa palsarum]|uniref:DNA-directed DNA polymerase n=1 Tax=Methylocapsa palsarum TaxID=1612308 RepID=A0A1I4CF98_9HYPH|nr:protein ImuB [Methylocapsa palsarum]
MLAGREGNRRIVLAADGAAKTAGLRVGMPLAKAQILAPGLIVQNADAKADAKALDRLAVWTLQRYAPMVAADYPDGIVIESTGADHLHGGEAAMLAGLVGRLAASGFAAKAAVADTLGAAHALARYAARPTLIATLGHGTAILAPLPLEALRLPDALSSELYRLGFERIGDVLAQPRAPLTLRFGPELVRRIEQALGERAEPIEPIRPPDMIEARRAFAEPIAAAETIARAIAHLTSQLCKALELKGLGARRLDLLCRRIDNQAVAVRVGLAAPSHDARRITRLFCDKIETIDPGFGIEVMTLAATVAEPLAPKQTVSPLGEAAAADICDLVDTLANRVGERAIYRIAPVASDAPERSIRHIPALAPETGATWSPHWPRPARLFPRPERIETVALLPDHPPAVFTWRGVRRRVRRADGPERLFGEWWKREVELCAVRDYFRIEDESGARYWIFRSGDGEDAATGSQRWFLHGIFG